MSSRYVSEFLGFKCAGDVLNAVPKMGKASKEITESMAIIKRLKPLVLMKPMEYSVVDLCAGNALTSVIAVHLLPVIKATAVDKKKRKGNYDVVGRFSYIEKDIRDLPAHPQPLILNSKDIIISVHPCKTADLVIDIFNNTPAHALILIPCCHGSSRDVLCRTWLHHKLSEYDLWTYHLAQKIRDVWVHVFTDNFVESPKNNVILAVKRGRENKGENVEGC